MFSLLSDIKFWSCEENINIKNTDFGAFRYHEKRDDGLYDEGKRSYCQKRDIIYTPQNKKGNKLKDGLKQLEEQLKDHSIVLCQWQDQATVQLVLNTGLLITIQLNLSTIDIEKMAFEKFLVGKVLDHISDAVMTKNHLICTQSDSQVTIVNFSKPRKQVFDKISKLEPKILTIDLSGPSGRRIEKKIRVNKSGDLILIWWKSTINEVYPWSPAMKEHDRANVHLYRLRGMKFELLCYLRTEFDPLCITFNSKQDNVIHSIEQKVSRKGEVTIEWQTYEVSQQDKLQRIEVVSIPLPTHTSCAKFSPNQDMLLLCCIDGSITLHDHTKGTNSSTKAGFIPTLASWHSDGFMFSIGNERGQSQHFDISLSCIKSQMLNEESTPANILDLSTYFKSQPALIKIVWSRKFGEEISYSGRYKNSDALLLLLFERGPIGVVRIVEGSNLSGDILVSKYLNILQPNRAISLLLSMDWDSHSRTCMHSLNQILNHLFKLPLIPERESLIQNALGSFHVPVRPISQTVEAEYGDEVRDLTRRFFHHLMRYQLFEKAFRLAIDLNDHDLFMDIHYYALVVNDLEMARAAKEKAELLLSRSNSYTSSHSTCSRPSCSLCSDSASENDSESYTEESESEGSPRRVKFTKTTLASRAPPLQVLDVPTFKNGFVSTSFNEISTRRNADNTLSTNFNAPDYPMSNSIPKLLPPSFTKPKNHKFRENSDQVSTSSSGFTNMAKDVLSASFGNLRIGGIYNRDVCSKNSGSFQTEGQQNIENPEAIDSNFAPDRFDALTAIEIPNSIEYSFMNSDSNVTSTSFNNPLGVDGIFKHEKTDSTIINMEPKCSSAFPDVSRHFFNPDNNLVSTSFNEEIENLNYERNDDLLDVLEEDPFDDLAKERANVNQETTIEVPPPPPAMTKSLENYLNSLPRKNLPLSRSTPGLSNIDEAILKFPFPRQRRYNTNVLQNSQSVSAILQNQGKGSLSSTKTYRFNYDLDHIQYSGSCENLNAERSFGISNNFQPNRELVDSKIHKSGGSQSVKSFDRETKINMPPLPVISSPNLKVPHPNQGSVDSLNASTEKPKVKFSNTVTHILVPGTGQSYRPIQKRPITKLHQMDPKRELAESLPLCLGNEDYLKDFQPLSKDSSSADKLKDSLKTEETAKIKVVHFGLL